ncbi:hypothetical protein GF362_06390 [Candidatus Dojkabacteria bacterium]|nr:hypothetical protein [Candidatus Dojkabacteria bacterium]
MNTRKIFKNIVAIFIMLASTIYCPVYLVYGQESISESLLTEMYSTGEEETNPNIPYNIFISNPSTTSFTINWLTKEPTTGSVIHATNTEELSKRSLDKRDSIGNENSRYTHSVDIVDPTLSSTDIVYFKLVSNDYEIGNNGGNFTYSPIEPLDSPPSPISQDGNIEVNFKPDISSRDFLIVANVDKSSVWVSTIVSHESLNWNLPFGNALTADLSSYASPSTDILYFEVYGENKAYGSLETQLQDTPITITVEGEEMTTPTELPTSTSSPPATSSPTPSPTLIPNMENLPTTGIKDYLRYLPGLLVLSLGIYFIYLIKEKNPEYHTNNNYK